MNGIINSGYSKPELIDTCHQLILYGIRTNDYEGVRRVKDFLISDIEDSNYAAFDVNTYSRLLYWIHDYNSLLDHIRHFDSLEISNREKITPDDFDLMSELYWSITHAGEIIADSIDKSDLKNEFKEVLKLFLNVQMDGDSRLISRSEMNSRARRFIFKYPRSEFNEYIRNHIKSDTYLSVGMGMEFFSGMSDLQQYS